MLHICESSSCYIIYHVCNSFIWCFVYILRCIRRHFPSLKWVSKMLYWRGCIRLEKQCYSAPWTWGWTRVALFLVGEFATDRCIWLEHWCCIYVCVNGIRLLCARMNIICLYDYAPKIPQFQPLLCVLSVNLSCVAAQLFYRTCIVSSACEAKAVILYAGDKFSGNQWPPWSDL